MNILILAVQVPYVRGGAEILTQSLKDKIQEAGHRVDIVTLPFRWIPKTELVKNCLAWKLMKLDEINGEKIDRVIATKFPSYFAEHPGKVTWLVHQFREIYDLYNTRYTAFHNELEDNQVREAVIKWDSEALKDSRRVYTISKNVSNRLLKFNGRRSTPLYPPPHMGDRYRTDSYGDFVLCVGRLEGNKRPELIIKAMQLIPDRYTCVMVGTGSMRKALDEMCEKEGVTSRVRFAGEVDDRTLLDLYAQCGCVFYGPIDEDYGYVTVEAMKSRKPVVTCRDSGGTLEFVTDGETGMVTATRPEEIAAAVTKVLEDRDLARRLGETGADRVACIGWDRVIESLVGR
ncbi:MAG: glycosyltransferase family 4 protein [Acidobacteria bacterium]|nr:glycosyltransferase family 4 protein [Acidobacteriota bacterium]